MGRPFQVYARKPAIGLPVAVTLGNLCIMVAATAFGGAAVLDWLQHRPTSWATALLAAFVCLRVFLRRLDRLADRWPG